MARLMKNSTIPALALLAACTAGSSGDVTRLKTEPVLSGGTYSTGGGITVASAFRDIGGQTAVCGLWSESAVQTPYTKGKAKKVLSSGAVYLDGARLLSGVDFFAKIPPTTDYATVSAPCAVTEAPWRPGYADRVPDIRLPQQIVYQDRGGIKGPIVEFRQTGPGALGGSLNLVQAVFGNTVRLPLGDSPHPGRRAVQFRGWCESRGGPPPGGQ